MFFIDSLADWLGNILTYRLQVFSTDRLASRLAALPLTPHPALRAVGHPGQLGLLPSELLVAALPLLLLLLSLARQGGVQLESCERPSVGQGDQHGGDLLGLLVSRLYALIRQVQGKDLLHSGSLGSRGENVLQGRRAERTNPRQEFTGGKFPGVSTDNLLL